MTRVNIIIFPLSFEIKSYSHAPYAAHVYTSSELVRASRSYIPTALSAYHYTKYNIIVSVPTRCQINISLRFRAAYTLHAVLGDVGVRDIIS